MGHIIYISLRPIQRTCLINIPYEKKHMVLALMRKANAIMYLFFSLINVFIGIFFILIRILLQLFSLPIYLVAVKSLPRFAASSNASWDLSSMHHLQGTIYLNCESFEMLEQGYLEARYLQRWSSRLSYQIYLSLYKFT